MGKQDGVRENRMHEGFKSNKGVGEYVKEKAEVKEVETKAPVAETVADTRTSPPDPPSITQFVGTDEDLLVSGIIAEAGAVDEEAWEKTFLEIKNRGNYYDLIRNMYPFHLPDACQVRFEGKVSKYGWIGKENMEVKCDPSRVIYWTPVNRNNHPEIPRMMFNKHGGVMREGMYLCYMPWRMYEARQDLQQQMSRMKYEELEDLKNVDTEIGGHFDPTEGGRRSAGRPGDIIMEEGVISHPDDSWQEAGDK